MWLYYLLTAALGYLLGSIPTGYLVGRAYGIDVREHGSGNIGATNVVRVLGKKPGYFVFVCDALKGFLAVWLTRLVVIRLLLPTFYLAVTEYGLDPTSALSGLEEFDTAFPFVGIVAALACILGHNFPVWLRFRGGKGVATTVGALLGLMPLAVLIVAVVWIAIFFGLRYVSLASIVAAAVLPVAVWVLGRLNPSKGGENLPMLGFSIAAAALVWWRHRTNIQRLLNGTETRFNRKPR